MKHHFKVKEQHFIDIKRPEEAYLLGFLWADGYFRETNDVKERKCQIRLEILFKDAIKIIKLFKLSGEWWFGNRERIGKQKQGIICTSNPSLFDFLTNYGYKSNRNNFKSIMNYIPKEFVNYWILGYFDGDGNAYYNKKNRTRHITFSGRYDNKWKSLIDILSAKSVICKETKVIGKSGNRSSYLRISDTNSVRNLYEFLYKSSSIGLKRKRRIIEQMI